MERSEYIEQIKKDVLEWIGENEEDFKEKAKEGREAVEEWLNDELFNNDSVTGNASGSYTFSTWQAEENIAHERELIEETAENFGETAGELWERGAEAVDVSIRCYLLGEAIGEALDEVEENDPNAFEESEEE